MKKVFAMMVVWGCCGILTTYAQPREDPDMTAYRARNAGAAPGWTPQDGLGPAINVHPTGATIGHSGWNNGVNVHPTGATISPATYNYPGWNRNDGLGPVVVHHNINSNNSNPNWNNNNNQGPNWNNNNVGSHWGGRGNDWNNNWNNWNNGSWGNNWGSSWWNSWGNNINVNSPLWGMGGISSAPWYNYWHNRWWNGGGTNITINNYYDGSTWWRDLRNAPPGSMMNWGNNNYYYHDGNFFSVVNGIYQVVLPVLGLILNSLPAAATPMPNYNNYYNYHGVYYYYTGQNYRVVAPPVGACLPSLPYFAKPTIINGISCYSYDNVYIQPTYNIDGDYCYRVVRNVY